MLFIDHNTSRTDLEVAILSDNSLYAMVNEQKFLDAKYSDEELRDIITDWIEAGNEVES